MFPFKKKKLYSKKYIVPNNYLSIVSQIYGPKWKIPDKKKQVYFMFNVKPQYAAKFTKKNANGIAIKSIEVRQYNFTKLTPPFNILINDMNQ